MKQKLLFRTCKLAVPFAAMAAMMAACVDDIGLGADKPSKLEQVYFTASIAEQDFFGEHKPQTRSAADERQRVMSSFYDLAIDGRNDIRLSVSTVDGMFGKPSPIPEEGKENRKVRGTILTELQQEPMRIMETCHTSAGKTLIGEPYSAFTEDGTSWGGSLMEHNANTTSRTIRAIYPESPSALFNKDGSTIELTTQSDASEQKDFLFAQYEQTLGQSSEEPLHLTFDHLLTAVRFKVGGQQLPMSVIKRISISGVATRGSYDCQSRSWNIDAASKGTVTANLDFNVTGVENTVINGAENTFMLLPQKLPADAKVTIEYEDYTEDDEATWGTKTLTATLATTNTPAWEPGQCVTYTLMNRSESNEYVLEVETPADFTPEGGTQAVNVLSYRHVEGVRTPMRWLVQSYSSDGGKTWMSGGNSNPPKGLSVSPIEGTSTEATPISVTLFPAERTVAPHSDFLQYKTPLGYGADGAFDLSTHDYLNQPCLRTTANCYVVDAPGKYRFPTAYGNAIVDGETNATAYAGYADYRGDGIAAPMIRNNNISLQRATLLWEDAPSLIDPASIKLVDDGNAVEFELLPANIAQGNAVIAVLDRNGTVVWNWHIWVTDEKATFAEGQTMQNKYGEEVEFMSLPLGWCSDVSAMGSVGREAAVRITMPSHMTSRASFRIRQTSTAPHDTRQNHVGNATYYNWGRKDPFPGARSTGTPVGFEATDTDCEPKKFYQAGEDAAARGLHAEMYVSYGQNYLALFGAGALNAFNGFMTGVMIGNIYNYFASSSAGSSAQVAQQVMEKGEQIGEKTTVTSSSLTGAMDNVEQTINTSKSAFNSLTDGFLDNVESLGTTVKEFRGIGGVPTIQKELLNGAGDVIGYVEVSRISAMAGEAPFTVSFFEAVEDMSAWVSAVGNAAQATTTVGPFSTALIASSVVAGRAIGFLDVLQGSNFYNGDTSWSEEMKSYGVSLATAIQHPDVLYRNPISWTSTAYNNLWNANHPGNNDPNTKVVKSVYDPCPAGYCVPTARDFSGITDDNSVYYNFGGTKVETEDGEKLFFQGLGTRHFWSGERPNVEATNDINTQIRLAGKQAYYWTASPAVNPKEKGQVGAYVINMRGKESYDDYGEKKGTRYTPRVINDLMLQQSYAMPVRPVREKR